MLLLVYTLLLEHHVLVIFFFLLVSRSVQLFCAPRVHQMILTVLSSVLLLLLNGGMLQRLLSMQLLLLALRQRAILIHRGDDHSAQLLVLGAGASAVNLLFFTPLLLDVDISRGGAHAPRAMVSTAVVTLMLMGLVTGDDAAIPPTAHCVRRLHVVIVIQRAELLLLSTATCVQ